MPKEPVNYSPPYQLYHVGDSVYNTKAQMFGEVVKVEKNPSYVTVLYEDGQTFEEQHVNDLEPGLMRVIDIHLLQPGDLLWFNNNEYAVIENDPYFEEMTIQKSDHTDVPITKSWVEWDKFRLRERSVNIRHQQYKLGILTVLADEEDDIDPANDVEAVEIPEEHQSIIDFIADRGRKHLITKLYYTDRFGNPTTRRIEAYEIRYPYLWAWSLEPGSNGPKGIRSFRIDRINNAKKSPGRFIPRFEIKL